MNILDVVMFGWAMNTATFWWQFADEMEEGAPIAKFIALIIATIALSGILA